MVKNNNKNIYLVKINLSEFSNFYSCIYLYKNYSHSH